MAPKQPIATHRYDAHGSAAFAGLEDANTGRAETGIRFGQLRTRDWTIDKKRWFSRKLKAVHVPGELGQMVYGRPESNALICAPSGAGKGVSIIIPTLLRYEGSVFTIDPKGENAVVTRRRRQELGQTVHFLNPWGLHDLPNARINPIDLLEPDDPNVVNNASFLADLCVVPAPDSKDPFWDTSARSLIRGLMLYTAAAFATEGRSLGTVRRLLTQTPDDLVKNLQDMADRPDFGGVLAECGNQFRGMERKTLSNVLSTCQAHTDFLTEPVVRASLEASDFSFSDLHEKKTTVYTIIPAYALETQARWLRLVVGMAVTAMERGGNNRRRCLFLLDEFPALGRLKKIETGIATLRGYGVDFALVVQDLNQLKAHYGKGGDSILSNCAYKHFMRVADVDTAKYVSELLGKETVIAQSESQNPGGPGRTLAPVARPLKTPDEIISEKPRRGYLVRSGDKPVFTEQITYLEEPTLRSLADENPYHQSDEAGDDEVHTVDLDEVRRTGKFAGAEIEAVAPSLWSRLPRAIRLLAKVAGALVGLYLGLALLAFILYELGITR